jgi:hypothetical protein
VGGKGGFWLYIRCCDREYGRSDPSRWPRGTFYQQTLAITSSTSGGRSVGIVRSRTQTWSKVNKVLYWDIFEGGGGSSRTQEIKNQLNQSPCWDLNPSPPEWETWVFKVRIYTRTWSKFRTASGSWQFWRDENTTHNCWVKRRRGNTCTELACIFRSIAYCPLQQFPLQVAEGEGPTMKYEDTRFCAIIGNTGELLCAEWRDCRF